MKYFFKALYVSSLFLFTGLFASAQTISPSEAIGFGYYEGDKVLSVYTSSNFSTIAVMQNTSKSATVIIPPNAQNKVLVLSGYRPITWTLLNPHKVALKQIMVTGYHKQTVVNAGGVPVSSFIGTDGAEYRVAYMSGGSSFTNLTSWLKTKNVTLKAEDFSAAGRAPNSTRLLSSVTNFSSTGSASTFSIGQPVSLSYAYAADVSSKETYQVSYKIRPLSSNTPSWTTQTKQLSLGAESGVLTWETGITPVGTYEISSSLTLCSLSGCEASSSKVVATSTPIMVSLIVNAQPPVVQQGSALPSTIGAYFWGGFQTSTRENDLRQGVVELQKGGFKNMVRIVLQPRVKNIGNDDIYGFAKNLSVACPNDKPFLPCAVQSSYYKDMFSLPGLSTIVLTTYDSTSSGSNGYATDFTNPDILGLAAKQEAIRNEYKEMTLSLYRQFAGSNKTFIISNWETDNTIYCGESYSYVTSATFKSNCDSQALTPTKRIAGLTQWFKLRKEGINLGRSAALAEGLSGVSVYDSIEFNSMNLLQKKGYASTLQNIIQTVKPAYASYSAWDSVEGGTAERDFVLAKSRLLAHGTKLIIGELGFRDMTISQAQEWRFRETVKTVLRLDIPSIIWEAYPGTGLPDYLVNSNGIEEKILSRLRDELLSYIVSSSSSYAINSVVDRGVSSGSHYFELYGSFTPSGNTASAVCGGQSFPVKIEYNNSTQINVSIQNLATSSWCTFAVTTSSGVSLKYGLPHYMALANSLGYSIKSIVDRGTSAESKHFFELYGSFNPSGNTASASCDGQIFPAAVTYSGASQVNVSLLNVPATAWCTFSVVSTSTGATLQYGPVKLCSGSLGGSLTCPNVLVEKKSIPGELVALVKNTLQINVPKSTDEMEDARVLGASTKCVNLSRNLHRGNESVSTKVLQDFLHGNGFLIDVPTGFYGDKTIEAVKEYQSSKGLPNTGMVYAMTRAAIRLDTCGSNE